VTIPANYKQVLAFFEARPKDIQVYFESFPSLVLDYEWDVSISYVFSRIETAKHTTLYCGLVKRHWTDAKLTRELLDRDHMSRGRFRELFKVVFDQPLPDAVQSKLTAAEKIRDKVAHGKVLSAPDARQCLADAFTFAESFSDFVQGVAGFRPFGQLKGFKGRAESLSKETTRWVLRGMGIPAKSPELSEG
jgi:hypothetical protein